MSTLTIEVPAAAAEVADKPSGELLGYVIRFPLRPITDDADYDAAAAILQEIDLRRAGGAMMPADVAGYQSVLSMLIRQFDQSVGDLPTSGTLAERMQTLLDASGFDRGRLAEIAGVNPNSVGEVLAGRQGWGQDAIRRLAGHFRLDAGYFLT